MRVVVPSGPRLNVLKEFGPAFVTTRWPVASKVIANGTVSGSEFTTGASDSRPLGATANTSRAFVDAFVVTRT
jgi:hypothetical protein